MQQHFVQGVPWRKTELYRRQARNLPTAEYQTESDLAARYASLDRIFEQVAATKSVSSDPQHLVRVTYLRADDLAWGPDGRHRIAMAILAGIDSMPVNVLCIHRDSVVLRGNIDGS